MKNEQNLGRTERVEMRAMVLFSSYDGRMKMEVPQSTVLFTDDDIKNLELLLDVFGSVVSLNEISATYVYGKANWNSTIASDILVEMQAGTSASEEKTEDSLTLTSESDLRK
ncbi:hypothetical protein K7X08_035764 [Anisodus acutangulus]|uniref:Uncharacterized protein n=1 Tax=Anisodus acutangulus TaxID=402998 RepID=A0A9Q1L5K8_9SOLA|nr:hypothetical protein K7X08_035764 [Anisodus acutangulus]